jgi:UDP-glucose:(heptosyl)LPS alpha-1,3-glucosyltransferase
MRIAFLIDRFDRGKGGAERWIALLLEELSARGHAVDLCAMDWRGLLPAGARPVRVAVPPLPRPVRDIVFARRAAALLEDLSPDVSVSLRHIPGADVFLALGGLHIDALRGNALAGGSPARNLLRALSWKHRALLRLERDLLLRKDPCLVIAPSPLVLDGIHRAYPASRARVEVIPHGIDTGRIRPAEDGARASLRAKLGFAPDDIAALFVSHNFRLKGLDRLVDAWRVLGGSFRLRVLGRDRPPRGARGVPGIEFAGERSDVIEHLQAADLLVHPTFHDPFPLAVLEALACGLPVVTTRANGIAPLMTDGVEGFVIDDARDTDALAERLRRFADRDLARSLRAGARKLAESLSARDLLERTAAAIEGEARRLGRGERSLLASSTARTSKEDS